MNWTSGSYHGWGRVPNIEARACKLTDRDEVARALKEAREAKVSVIAHGAGRSYGDVALPDTSTSGQLLLAKGLGAVHSFDEDTGLLHCGGGVTLEDIIRSYLPQGWFPSVVPGTKFVTVAGAIANDIHGKNQSTEGNFGHFVESIELMLSSGDVVVCSRSQEPELFHATIAGMGLTGIILSATLRLTRVASPWVMVENIRYANLDEFLEIDAASKEYSHTVSWVDCLKTGDKLGRGVYMRGRFATDSDGPLPEAPPAFKQKFGMPFFAPAWSLNALTVRAFNAAYFYKPSSNARLARTHADGFFFPLDGVANWNRMYGRRGFLQYQIVVPPEKDGAVMSTLLTKIAKSGMSSFLAVIKELKMPGEGMLSFTQPGITLALDFPNYGEPLLRLLTELDQLVLEAGGRVNLSKDARLAKSDFQKMYPRWEEWRQVREKWDPEGLFASSMSQRLGLTSS